MNVIVATQGLCKQYGKALRVKDLDLSVPEGAVYGFLGPNGAGKTTTLKMILGLAKPSAGTITVFGQPVNAQNRLAILKQVGALIESPSYYGHLTGAENLRIVQTLRGAPEADIARVLHIVRLENQRDKLVNHYSLGMKQRLGLAAALLGSPRLLVLDEPTNGLDPAGIQEIRDLIHALPQQYGMTVLVSSHLLSEIDQMASMLGIIRQGELVFQGSLSVLHEKSKRNIAVRTLNNATSAHILREKSVPYQVIDDFLVLPDLNDEQVARCTALLAEGGVGLVRVEERQKSLEDIFLELTGKAMSL